MTHLPEAPLTPYHLGPTWARDEDGAWRLPRWTLGWEQIGWISENLLLDGEPVRLTDEQCRFILWMYAVDHRGRFVFRDIVLQRMKGWGKDPIAAIIAALEFVGPCRFSHWGLDGEPVARTEINAWVQVVAVAQEQTKNTMALIASIFSPACIAANGIDLGREKTYAWGGRRLEITSSAPATMEGNRPTFVIRNETHWWRPTTDGIQLHKVIRRNLAKNKGGQARGLSITNAYDPSVDSVAKRQRESYLAQIEGRTLYNSVSTVMYDSLEAPVGSTVFPDFTRWDEAGQPVKEFQDDGKTLVPPSEEVTRHYIKRILLAVRGDADWLDIERLTEEILDPDTDLEESKRFYYNSLALGDDIAFKPEDIKATMHDVALARRIANTNGDPLRVGWSLVTPDDECVMFGDGSKSNDSTGLVLCRLSDGYTFTAGVWQKPKGDRGRGWLAPREQIDARVREVVGERLEDGSFRQGRFKVVAFWFDPSHTVDDQDSTRYWDNLCDAWHRDFGDVFQYWAANSGDRRSSVAWDMTSPSRQTDFVMAVERFTDEMESHAFQHDGHPALVEHLRNARSHMTKWGWSIAKASRSSRKKIDLAVCAIGARMLRRAVLNKGVEQEESKASVVWW